MQIIDWNHCIRIVDEIPVDFLELEKIMVEKEPKARKEGHYLKTERQLAWKAVYHNRVPVTPLHYCHHQ